MFSTSVLAREKAANTLGSGNPNVTVKQVAHRQAEYYSQIFDQSSRFLDLGFSQLLVDAEAQGIYVSRGIDGRQHGPPANSHRRATTTIELTWPNDMEGNR